MEPTSFQVSAIDMGCSWKGPGGQSERKRKKKARDGRKKGREEEREWQTEEWTK